MSNETRVIVEMGVVAGAVAFAGYVAGGMAAAVLFGTAVAVIFALMLGDWK